ncbi:hypothetical protein [Thalassospira xiamenensis]|uniref:hypothetical protein n=1 Tax=Thalassospira xiamenensis TaxID=220697 RepID=UPI003AA9A35C
MSSNIEIICEWIRHPDNAETFTAGDLVMWANDRPTGEALSLKREFETKDALISEMVGALEESEEYFDQRSDADMDQDGYIPNEEMKILTVVRTALTKAREQVK